MLSASGLGALRPLLRFLLPVLLFTATAEMVLSRVLTRGGLFWYPGGRPGPAVSLLLEHLGYYFFNFSVVMAVGLLALLGFATWWLRSWVPGLSVIGPGLAVLAIWSLARGIFPSIGWTATYQSASLLLALAILAAYYEGLGSAGPRAFVILLGASLACAAYASIMTALRGSDAGPLVLPTRQAGELLALASGAVAARLFPASELRQGGPSFAHATAAALLAGLFFLLYGRGPAGAAPGPRWSLGWSGDLPLPGAFEGLVYAGALFLFLFALFRALADPRWRLCGYGLAFLFLAGFQFRLIYQHLLALIGLVLLTRGGSTESLPEPQSEPAAV